MRQSDRKTSIVFWRAMGCAATMIVGLVHAARAHSSEVAFGFGGRFVNASGAPVAGPVEIEVNFFDADTGGNKLGTSPYPYENVSLSDGVFSLQITPGADLNGLFPDPAVPTWIEVKDKTHGVTYPRQRLLAVPFALKLPVDGKTLTFDATGKLTLALTSLPASNEFLTMDANGGLVWASPATASPQAVGNAITALTGDITASGAGSATATLATTGVSAGSYTKVTVDTKGRVTSATTLAASDLPDSGVGAGTYTKITVDAKGRATTGAALVAGDIPSLPANIIPLATTSADGYLSATDWASFAAKQAALGYTPVNKAGDTMTGNLSMGGSATVTNLLAPSASSDAATKAYVDTAVTLGNPFPTLQAVSSNYSIVGADNGKVLNVQTASILTLPLISAVPTNFRIRIRNRSSGAVTVTPSGANTVQGLAGSLTMSPKAGDADLYSNGTSWQCLACSSLHSVVYANTTNSLTGATAASPWALEFDATRNAQVFSDSPGGNYANSVNASLTLPAITLTDPTQPTSIYFYEKFDLEACCDSASFELSTDSGSTWNSVYTATGTRGWSLRSVDVTGIVGSLAANSSILLRFRIQADGGVVGNGWSIDGVTVASEIR